jgi:hypothetical protein
VSTSRSACALSFGLAVSAALTANTAMAQGEIDPAAIKDIRKVAVVALIPEVLEVSRIGKSGFTGINYRGPVDWWKTNAHIRTVLGGALKQRERFEVKDVPYDSRALTDLALKVAPKEDSNLESLRPALVELARAEGLDGVFLVLRGGRQGFLCRGSGCLAGYGNSGIGIHSVAANFGRQSAFKGDNVYISMRMFLVGAKDGATLGSTEVSGYNSVSFNGSEDFTGIPAPALEDYEASIKSLLDKHLPLAVARLGVLNSAPLALPSGDPSTVPALTVNNECCQHLGKLAAGIAQGYAEAIEKDRLKTGDESAVLTVKSVANSSRGIGMTRSTEYRIEGVLAFRGNEYVISDAAGAFGKLNNVANAIGAAALEKVRTVIDPSTRREKPSAFPKGPE